MTIRKILCVGGDYNCCQSAMMTAWFRKAIQDATDERRGSNYDLKDGKIIGVTVESAIISSSSKDMTTPTEDVINAMKEHGIDISDHVTKHIKCVDIPSFDLIICIHPVNIWHIAENHPKGLILLAEDGRFMNRKCGFEEYYQLTEEIHTFVDKVIKDILS